MINAQKPDHMSLNTLISRIKDGRYVIPDFQREFEWQPWDIKDLMRSIFLDYYIGSLLFWKGKKENFSALSCEDIYGFSGEKKPESIVLDGQQRITALYYVFHAPKIKLPNRANRAVFYIRVDQFMAEEYDEAFYYDWYSKRWSDMLENKDIQYSKHIFPLQVIGSGGWDLANWVQGYEKFWKEKANKAKESDNKADESLALLYANNANDFGILLKNITEQYQISYIELDREISIDKVCDIFTQINSRGIRLDTFDLLNALLKPKGLQLKKMWREAAPRLDFVDTPKMNGYILQVMSILRQAYCSPKYLYFLLPGQEKPIRELDGTRRKEILVSDVKDFKKLWDDAVDALATAIGIMRAPNEYGVISTNYFPYVSILPVFSALQNFVKSLPPNIKLGAQKKIQLWYWASVFTNRYSGSVESTSARDFIDVKTWILENGEEPSLVEEFRTHLKTIDLKKEIKSGTSIYNGIFNLFVIRGAKDWITGLAPSPDDLDDHHIVPVSWENENIRDDKNRKIHSILNRSPLTAETNRIVINNRLPNVYLPELIKNNGEEEVRRILQSHFISPFGQEILMREPFLEKDFDEFLTERNKTIIKGIEDYLLKEQLELDPQTQTLNHRIEAIELAIRENILAKSNGDLEMIPDHIRVKVKELIDVTLKKNITLDKKYYSTFSGMLEFFDLRQLEGLITYKSLWPKFEPVFGDKTTLIKKFDQLAELRNSIRHSRFIDEILHKEGEAAIIWFERILNI